MSMAMQRHNHQCGLPPRPNRHRGAVADVNSNAEAQLQFQGCLGGRPAITVLPPIRDHSHCIVIFHPHFILISFNSVQIYLSKSIVRIENGCTVKKKEMILVSELYGWLSICLSVCFLSMRFKSTCPNPLSE